LRIVFAGTPANAAQTLQALHAGGHNVVAVLTRPDAPIGRKRILTASPVAALAEDLGIPVIKANSVDTETLAKIATFNPDLGVIVAYGALLKQEALKLPAKGWINIHYSLLPKWRGASPVQSAILQGDTETGVTIFQLDAGMDTGAVHSSVPTIIEPGETSGVLLARLTNLGISLLMETLPRIEAGIAITTDQDPRLLESLPTAGKIDRGLARIDWSKSAETLEWQILAMNPEPMAWTNLEDSPLRILSARALGKTDWASLAETESKPGSITTSKERVLVHCGLGTILELKEVQPAGKNAMAATDWARGLNQEKAQFH
jgi:methionyl-tRNA formyltransferase